MRCVRSPALAPMKPTCCPDNLRAVAGQPYINPRRGNSVPVQRRCSRVISTVNNVTPTMFLMRWNFASQCVSLHLPSSRLLRYVWVGALLTSGHRRDITIDYPCPYAIHTEEEAIARQLDTSIPGNVVTVEHLRFCRTGNHFSSAFRNLALGYCCKSKLVRSWELCTPTVSCFGAL